MLGIETLLRRFVQGAQQGEPADAGLIEAAQPTAGWRMVPMEPTPEMAQIGKHAAPYRAIDVYRAMVLAAPAAPKAAPQPAENTLAQLDAMRSELAADIREVFDANGPETPQIVRDVIEYADSWLQAYIQRKAENAAKAAIDAARAAKEGQNNG